MACLTAADAVTHQKALSELLAEIKKMPAAEQTAALAGVADALRKKP